MIEIQNNVPVPTLKGRPKKYPLDTMEVGDSFFVATTTRSALGGPITRCRRSKGYRFTVRVLEENGVRGLRIWRTA